MFCVFFSWFKAQGFNERRFDTFGIMGGKRKSLGAEDKVGKKGKVPVDPVENLAKLQYIHRVTQWPLHCKIVLSTQAKHSFWSS